MQIYLDHNATTPLLPEVVAAMDRAMHAGFANAASQHGPGRETRRFIEDARERIAALLGADVARQGDRLIFTSGGTEANNLALCGLVDAATRPHVLVSAIEHPSIFGPAAKLAVAGCEIEQTPVDRQGYVDLDAFERMLRPETRLASIMLGNNETGVVQPVAEAAAICRRRGILLHTDAVQAVGKIGVNFTELNVDAMSVAAHKFHGPLGIGALLLKRGVTPAPLMVGGFQQFGLRPGTEAPVLIAGFLAAMEAWQSQGVVRTLRLAALRDDLQRLLFTAIPELVVHGAPARRLPQTLCVAFPEVDRQALFVALDQAGIACSTGSACASGSNEPSPTLRAMRVGDAALASSLRFSVGATTTADDIVAAAQRIVEVYRRLQARRVGRA